MSNPNGRGRLRHVRPLRAGAGPDIPSPGPEIPGPGREPGRPAPGRPGSPWSPGPSGPGQVPPTRIWLAPDAGWRDELQERLSKQRIVIASGLLDDPAAARLSAQLLTLDAEGNGPVRLELQNLQAELPAALTVMGVLDVVGAPIQAYAGGNTSGPALGVLACCPRRLGYPNASFTLSEPRLRPGGPASAVTAQEQQTRRLADSLFYRIAEATGRDAEAVRDNAERGRVLSVAEAIGYGLIHDRATRRTRLPAGRSGTRAARPGVAHFRTAAVPPGVARHGRLPWRGRTSGELALTRGA